jgi:hypothetical protein
MFIFQKESLNGFYIHPPQDIAFCTKEPSIQYFYYHFLQEIVRLHDQTH